MKSESFGSAYNNLTRKIIQNFYFSCWNDPSRIKFIKENLSENIFAIKNYFIFFDILMFYSYFICWKVFVRSIFSDRFSKFVIWLLFSSKYQQCSVDKKENITAHTKILFKVFLFIENHVWNFS